MRWRWCAGMRCSVTGSWWRGRAGLRGICGRRVRARRRWWGCAWNGGRGWGPRAWGGAASLPLDPAYPPARLEAMLAGGRAGLLAGTGEVLGGLRPGRVRVIELDDRGVAEQVAGMPGVPPSAGVSGGGLAYVIFTSGSTGAPKGVAVTHGGLANLAAALGPVLEAADGQAWVLQFASFSFDASVQHLVMLGTGAALVLPEAGQLLAGGELAGLVARRNVTNVTVPPAVLGGLEAG